MLDFMACADDVLKSMECESNLHMFKAIAHLQVRLINLIIKFNY